MAKRFRVFEIDNMYAVSDDIANITLAWDTSKTIMDGLCGLLNNLNDENESLQKKHRQLQMDFNEVCGILYDVRESKLDLEDENDDLKKELQVWKDTAESLECQLAHKIDEVLIDD